MRCQQGLLSVITFLSDSVSEGPSPPAPAPVRMIRPLRQQEDDADDESSLSKGWQTDIDCSLPGIACEAFTECDCGVPGCMERGHLRLATLS